MKKVIFWSVLASLFLALVQVVVLSNIIALPVMPDLVLLLVLYVSLKNGSVPGCTAGFISGIIMDFVSAAPLGLNAMTKTITGFAAGKFYASFNMQRLFVPIAAAFAATLLKALLVLMMTFFFGEKIMRYRLFSPVLWLEAAANAVCALFLFKLLDTFKPFFVIEEGERIQ